MATVLREGDMQSELAVFMVLTDHFVDLRNKFQLQNSFMFSELWRLSRPSAHSIINTAVPSTLC